MSVKIKRHIAKSITYRILGTLTTFLISWLLTGNISYGIGIGILDIFFKTILYFVHERLWYKSKFGVENHTKS